MSTGEEFEVLLCRMSDKRISVRINGKEVHVLPLKAECGVEELQEAMQDVANHVSDQVGDVDWDWN